MLGLILGERDDDEAATSLIEKAISLRPNAAPFHHNIAGIYRRMGKLTEAESEFRRAISLKPDYGEAYQGLAEMVTFEKGDPFIKAVSEQLNSGKLADSMRSYFHFAAGKYLDDIGDYRNAFEHYRLGNRAADKSFDSAEFRQQIKDTLYVFSREFVDAHRGEGDPSTRPVFIVGMPRSGTSLVEQILASHSKVYGAGELNDMKFVARLGAQISRVQQAYPNCVPGLSKTQFERLAADYLERISKIAPASAGRVVDKHPLNFQFVGLILLMFPGARIIHTVRHPLDTCLSCFFQNFTKGQHYSFDLIKLAHFYNDYRRVMEHFESLFPDRIMTVSYEAVTEDQEAQTRALLSHCDLDFEPRMSRLSQDEAGSEDGELSPGQKADLQLFTRSVAQLCRAADGSGGYPGHRHRPAGHYHDDGLATSLILQCLLRGPLRFPVFRLRSTECRAMSRRPHGCVPPGVARLREHRSPRPKIDTGSGRSGAWPVPIVDGDDAVPGLQGR
ncbi:MAG: sulfotransferase [Gammaproteobacteria bacterium]|nr:sulfotransferase [Gammaproteobacteria bacterium]